MAHFTCLLGLLCPVALVADLLLGILIGRWLKRCGGQS
jgi:hypothetical protein